MKSVECKIRVRYSEVGRQGYAHHAHYFNWFDIALESLIERCGMLYKDVEDLGLFLTPTIDKCKYNHPAAYNDELTIRLSVVDLDSVKIKFSYEILREKDAKLIAIGETEHVLVDNNFRPHTFLKALPKLYEMIKKDF